MQKVISEFFLDGAKIIFGSLVVGAFMPTAQAPISWITVMVGIFIMIAFLVIAGIISKKGGW
ncbi:MAG: hypothetical protein CEN89_714 [Candidatus Berkelbacteria bacterium Licking1014_7]|uniref:Uncharacterized protein n=1 Tax=Candidatus Berkelbacteria bacterium Licking1014_7 TaxID=2017147 RepID=A0A554LHT6_9BACT|nr:MAG: hypothetical protein CEN89_714 [Candidatus Berkelbacteria bacterium Licking1014_7]